MQFLPQKATKGQAMAYFLSEHLDPRTIELYKDLPDKLAEVYMTQMSFEEQVWQLFFDSASRMGPIGNIVAGVGVVLLSPKNYVIPCAFSLTEPCSNNVAEYNALLIVMRVADEIGVKNLKASLKISKHTVTQSSSSTRFAGSTRSDMRPSTLS